MTNIHSCLSKMSYVVRGSAVWREARVASAARWGLLWLLLALAGCGGAGMPPGTARNGGAASRTPAAVDSARDPAGAGESSDQSNAQHLAGKTKVSIDNFTFHPATLEVPAGTTIIWVNADDVPHTVRSTEDLFRSEALDTDDTFEHLFSKPGTYEYYCGVHPHMTGTIVVK